MDDKKIGFEAEFLSVLAQPTRLKILYFLRDGEKCLCEITPSMQEDPSVISRHLTKMKNMGLLDSRRRGVSVHYRITDEKVFEILKIVDEIAFRIAQTKVLDLSET